MTWHLIALLAGFALDLLIGDPQGRPHPVRAMGSLIAWGDSRLRTGDDARDRRRGVALVVLVAGASTAVAVAAVALCRLVSPWLACAAEAVICYYMLACKSLRVESMKVHAALTRGTLEEARHAVGMIVGRDTAALDEAGVARAAVETVAESASDGVVAPLLFMAVLGAPGAVLYKSVNTMDSMVGYKNDAYHAFGTAAARTDDVLNFLPARVAGALMCLAAPLARLDGAGAWRVFCRDRRNHTSPNSAHTEAACAGALGVQLGGPSRYFGRLVEKPTIGDAARAVEPDDIVRANRLVLACALLALVAGVALSLACPWWWSR